MNEAGKSAWVPKRNSACSSSYMEITFESFDTLFKLECPTKSGNE